MVIVSITCTTLLFAQVPVREHPDQRSLLESDDPRLAANKRMVFDFYCKAFQTYNMDLVPKYMREDYIQHNPTVPTGRKAFMAYFGQFEKKPETDHIEGLVNMIAEGDYVVLSFKVEYDDPSEPGKTYTTTWFDMFRIEEGKLAEHWDYGRKEQ